MSWNLYLIAYLKGMRKENPQTSVGPKAATMRLKSSQGAEEAVFLKKFLLFSQRPSHLAQSFSW